MVPVSRRGAAKVRSKRWLLATGIALGVLLLWVGPCVLTVMKVAGSLGLAGGKGAGPVVTVSEETTHIVRPLDEEGYVDYVAALNQRNREGVTPENNAVVLLWQALGPTEIPGSYGEEGRRELFRELGVSPPPEEGEYFVSLEDYSRELEEAGPPPGRRQSDEQASSEEEQKPVNWLALLREQHDRASERPWSPEEFPELAAWLDRNRVPLGLMVEGSRKERFYSPLIRSEESALLIYVLLPASQGCRETCRALEARALLRLHEGQVDEARQDLLACRRWARLVGQGPFLVEALIAYAIDRELCPCDGAVARHGNLTSDVIRQYQADLKKLGPLPNVVDKIDVAERFMFLDSIVAVTKGGPGVVDSPDNEEGGLVQLVWEKGGNRAIDWDTILRMGNGQFERVVNTARIADRSERARAAVEFDKEIGRQAEANSELKSFATSVLRKGPRQVATEKIGWNYLALLMPGFPAALAAEDRAIATFRMVDASLALAAYRADHGDYPESLAKLVPDYADEIPRDPFTGEELRYAPVDDDYLLYSVGPNGEDEEGRTSESDPEGDDVVIHTAPGR